MDNSGIQAILCTRQRTNKNIPPPKKKIKEKTKQQKTKKMRDMDRPYNRGVNPCTSEE